jgi:ribosomal protein S27AE
MKNSSSCPKCNSTEIIHIPGKGQKAGYDVGENIRTGRTNMNLAYVERYVCGACGFIEDWVESPAALAKIKEKFVN